MQDFALYLLLGRCKVLSADEHAYCVSVNTYYVDEKSYCADKTAYCGSANGYCADVKS